ncbi:MAG: hypothetical protein ACXU82_05715 [Caulobacteraceae bacterium]
MRRLATTAFLALAALPASAQIREPPALRRAHVDLQQCLGRAAGHASGQAEATRDTVADYAARQCEGAYVKTVTRRKLMDSAQARVEVNMMAYQLAERILSR